MSSRAADAALCRAWQSGDKCAGARIEAKYRALIHRWAGAYGSLHYSREDLYQDGVMALLHAASKYDPAADCSLLGYASLWLKARLSRASLANHYPVHVPPAALEAPHLAEIARAAVRGGDVDGLVDDAASPEALLIAADFQAKVRASVARANLTAREREIAEDHLLGDATLTELAERWGCSKQNVGQICNKAKRKLRVVLAWAEPRKVGM